MNSTLTFCKIAGRTAIFSLALILLFMSVNAATYTVTKTADTNDSVCDADGKADAAVF